MTIDDSSGRHDVTNARELEFLLRKRCAEGATEFWLSHDQKKSPAVALLVNGDISLVHYFPREGHPGFIPKGEIPDLAMEGTSRFLVDSVHEEVEISNSAVIPLSAALAVAKEFLHSPDLPKSIEWVEL